MKPIDVIILITSIAIVVGVTVLSLWRKKKGKTGCGCNGCKGCPSKGACPTANAAEKED